MDFTLHQLRIFQAVARARSYSQVAQELFITQPGVSMQVRALERAVGLPLFEKTGRAVQLTEAGRELLRYSEQVFSLLDEAKVVLEELSGLKRGTVKVAASTTAGIYVAPAALGAFHRRYSGIQLSLDVVNRFSVQQRLLDNEVDLAILGLLADTQQLEVAEFLPNTLVVIASPRHPLAGQSGITFETLASETFLLREAGSGTRADTESIFARVGFTPRVGMELRSMGAIKQAVAADLGIAVMPHDALELELAVGRLVILDVVGFPVGRHWFVVRRAGRHVSAAANALWTFLLDYRDLYYKGSPGSAEVSRAANLSRKAGVDDDRGRVGAAGRGAAAAPAAAGGAGVGSRTDRELRRAVAALRAAGRARLRRRQRR